MLRGTKEVLDDLIEAAAEIESYLNRAMPSEAREAANSLHSIVDKLISAIGREGLAIIEAEAVLAQYAEMKPSLEPVAPDVPFPQDYSLNAIPVLMAHWESRKQAAFQAAVSATQSSDAAILGNFPQ